MDFKAELEKLNITVSADIIKKFELYYNKLIEVNSYMNLTAITELDEVYIKHFLDSLYIIKAIDNSKPYNILDVGSGAGFPSIPLAKPEIITLSLLFKTSCFVAFKAYWQAFLEPTIPIEDSFNKSRFPL